MRDSIYGISHDHNDGEGSENALWFTQSTVYIVHYVALGTHHIQQRTYYFDGGIEKRGSL